MEVIVIGYSIIATGLFISSALFNEGYRIPFLAAVSWPLWASVVLLYGLSRVWKNR